MYLGIGLSHVAPGFGTSLWGGQVAEVFTEQEYKGARVSYSKVARSQSRSFE